MTTRRSGPVVLIADPEAAPSLATRLAPLASVTWYASVEDLVRGQPLSSVAVLVIHSSRLLRGRLLVTLGRMGLEYPRMQKALVTETPPPLPIAEYLTACGVDLVWAGNGDEVTERLASVVDGMQERTAWLVA